MRVLIVDDSRTSRALLRQLCEAQPGITVVGEAGDGLHAVRQVALLSPSIVVMDIEMPGLDGIEATRRIMSTRPTPILIVTAHHDAQDVALSLRAVHAGALSLAPKPTGPGNPGYAEEAARFVRLVKALAAVRPVRRSTIAAAPGTPPGPAASPADDGLGLVRIVGVAASTGGPAAVYRLLELLPAALPVPLLVVQHIADGFAPGLAAWLGGATRAPVKLAEDGESLIAGSVYVAPGGAHLQVSDVGRVVLSDALPSGGFRPSATVLFRSLAAAYGSSAVGVVLTGMGSDGLEGARDLRRAGAAVLAQDADSSAVFGMPRAVTEAGLATAVGTVDDLAQRLARALLTDVRRKRGGIGGTATTYR